MPEKDFYLDERNLASYFEKDWADHFVGEFKFGFAPYSAALLYSDYHERLVDFINARLEATGARPADVLEIGSALGRTFFEVCRKIPSVQNAVLVEPSANLGRGFARIFSGESPARITALKGNVDTQEILLETRAIQAAAARVARKNIEATFQELPADLGEFDLVICSNVMDQCKDPELLVEVLKKSTRQGGVLALSCSYQWQEKYIGNAVEQILNINYLFNEGWQVLGEENLPFQFRKYERYWMNFLAHVLVLKKL